MNINKSMNRKVFACCRENRLRDCFRKEGGRLTGPRKAIIDFFHSNRGHFTAEEVFEKILKQYPGLGIATVYRTIASLCSAGLISRVDFPGEVTRYELSEAHEGRKHHHHLVCENCGRIFEYDDFMEEEKEFFRKIEKVLSLRHNFLIKGHSLYFQGFCSKCRDS